MFNSASLRRRTSLGGTDLFGASLSCPEERLPLCPSDPVLCLRLRIRSNSSSYSIHYPSSACLRLPCIITGRHKPCTACPSISYQTSIIGQIQIIGIDRYIVDRPCGLMNQIHGAVPGPCQKHIYMALFASPNENVSGLQVFFRDSHRADVPPMQSSRPS